MATLPSGINTSNKTLGCGDYGARREQKAKEEEKPAELKGAKSDPADRERG